MGYVHMWQNKLQKKIGEMLVEAKLITERHLNFALEKQSKNAQPVGRNLIDMGYVTESNIARYIAKQHRVPYISLDGYSINKNLLHIVPESLSENYGIVPLDLIGDILTLGITGVPDEISIRQIEELTGFKIQVMIITAGDFCQYMQRVYNFSGGRAGEFDAAKIRKFIKIPAYNGRERRRAPRYRKKITVKYDYRNEYNINSTINISKCGVLIKTKSPVPVNSYIAIKMKLPGLHEDIIVISRVVRVGRVEKKGNYHVALDFGSMEASDSRKLAEFMNRIF